MSLPKSRKKSPWLLFFLLFTTLELNGFSQRTSSDIGKLHYEVLNRLAVLMVMSGDVETSVQLGKMAQRKRSDEELLPELSENSQKLLVALEGKGLLDESKKWKEKISRILGKTEEPEGTPLSPPVFEEPLKPKPVAVPQKIEKIPEKKIVEILPVKARPANESEVTSGVGPLPTKAFELTHPQKTFSNWGTPPKNPVIVETQSNKITPAHQLPETAEENFLDESLANAEALFENTPTPAIKTGPQKVSLGLKKSIPLPKKEPFLLNDPPIVVQKPPTVVKAPEEVASVVKTPASETQQTADYSRLPPIMPIVAPPLEKQPLAETYVIPVPIPQETLSTPLSHAPLSNPVSPLATRHSQLSPSAPSLAPSIPEESIPVRVELYDPRDSQRISKPLIPKIETIMVPKDLSQKPPEKVVTITKDLPNQLKKLSSLKVSLVFKEAEISDIVRLLAEKAGLNYVSKNPIVGKTSVKFENIPIGTALDTILKHNNYSYEVKDEIIWVFKRGEEPLVTRIFFIQNIDAADLFDVVKNCLSQEDSLQQPQASTGLVSGSSSSMGGQQMPGGGSPSGEGARTQTQTYQPEPQNGRSSPQTSSAPGAHSDSIPSSPPPDSGASPTPSYPAPPGGPQGN